MFLFRVAVERQPTCVTTGSTGRARKCGNNNNSNNPGCFFFLADGVGGCWRGDREKPRILPPAHPAALLQPDLHRRRVELPSRGEYDSRLIGGIIYRLSGTLVGPTPRVSTLQNAYVC